MIRVFFFIVLFFSTTSFAFPELIRHGYVNCVSCHYSPSGGGVLTPYGRALSGEVLSTWASKNEENFLYLKKKPKKWWAVGGDFRAIVLKRGTSNTTTYIPMERDLEGAVNYKKFTLVATAGFRDPIAPETDSWLSRRHYLLYQMSDEWALRAGRFYPSFGINIQEHTAVIRKNLGWDETMESYNLELSYLGEKYNMHVTGILGRPDFASLYRESGGAVSVAYQPADTYKIGASYYYGGSDLWTHHYIGPFALLGFTPKFFSLFQVNGARSFSALYTEPQWGLVDYLKLDYELFQGMHLYLTQELSQLDLTRNATRMDLFTTGLQFFPRPHFEFQLYWQKKYTGGIGNSPTDIYMLYAHFYP